MTLSAHHEQVRPTGRPHHHLGRVALDNARADHHVRRDAADLGERPNECLSRVAFQID